jgi:predicted MPP superfamily phosphohydrolase
MFFRLIVLAVVLSVQTFLYVKARRWALKRFPTNSAPRHVLTALFIAFNASLVVFLMVRIRAMSFPEWAVALAIDPFFIWHGASLILGAILIALTLAALPFRWLAALLRRIPATRDRIRALAARPDVQRFDASRRKFLRQGVYGLTTASFGGAAYGVLEGRNGFERTDAHFVIPNLHPDFEGFTIGLLSDIHSSAFMTKPEMDAYVKGAMSLGADLLVVTGDFVNSQTEEVYPFAEAFSSLKAPYGVFGVMGNHDFFAQDPERVAREVDDCGIALLRNDHSVIEKGKGALYILGVDDVGRPDRASRLIRTAGFNTPRTIPRILLCHRPYFLPQAAEQNIDLVLSGHTHGGQVVLGRFGGLTVTPAALFSPYIWGPYRFNTTSMYVSRGIGTVGIPMRVNCPPEITKIVLTRA